MLGYLHANDEQRLEAAKDKFLNAYGFPNRIHRHFSVKDGRFLFYEWWDGIIELQL